MNQLHQACSSFVSYLCLGLSIFAAGCAARDEPPAGGEDTAESPSDLYALSTSIWPSASIPVCWENGTAATAEAQGWTQAAVQAAWPAVSGVSLTGWGNCVPGAKGIRILIEDSGPLTLELGRNLDGLVNGMHLNFTFNNWSQTCIGNEKHCIEVIGVHEFGHALGFSHEQNRPDRPASCTDAPQGPDGDVMIGPWDAASIMDYCPPGQWGSNAQLSPGDKQGIQQFYGLLANPDGSKGDLSGWTLTANGGIGWAVDSGDFVTSYGWDRRTQLIDLWAHGFDQEAMASAPPITVSERFSKTYCADSYYLKVQLLDGNMNVVSTYGTGVLSTGGACDLTSNWQTLSHVFTNYGANVRYIRWEDGGTDSEHSPGRYGARMNNAVLKINRTPLVYGTVYSLQNGFNSWGGGYLDTRGSGCSGNVLCVSTATSPNRDGYSGQWILLSADGKALGANVRPGDKVYLASAYPYIAGSYGGYLDTRGAGCQGNLLCVSTATSSNRESGSGRWMFRR